MIYTYKKLITKSAIAKFALLLVLALSTSCTKDLFTPDGNDDKKENNEDKENPSGGTVDFATRHEATINIDYGVNFSVPFEVYLENPLQMDEDKNYVKDSTLFCVTKGWTGADGKISLPWLNKADIITEIYVYSPSLSVSRVIKANAEGEVINAIDNAENLVTKSKAPLTKGSANGSYYTSWKTRDISYVTFNEWDNNGVPKNLLPNKITVSDKAKRVIDATLPAEGSNELQIEYKGGDLYISENAHVDLYFYSHNSGRKNTLAYFVYEKNTKLSLDYINQNLIIAYPNTNNAVESLQGIRLKYYKDGQFTDEFPAGVNIGWTLIVNEFDNGTIPNKNVNILYSNKKFNAYNMKGSTMSDRPHISIFKADNRYVLAFEDQPWGNANHANGSQTIYPIDLRDDIFIIHADPVSSLPDDIPDGKDPIDPDFSKDFPIATQGTVAFEDLWPNEGDYDMNDVVVSYEMKDFFNNSEFGYSGFEGTFTYKHNGAQRSNAFGFQLETSRDNISYINITSDYSCAGQGLDSELDKATIMLFDNGKNVPIGTTFHVKVAYKKAIASYGAGYKTAPYNPFIAVNAGPTQSNRAECHLTNYAPTAKADQSMLGTFNDNSDPANGKYYISKNSMFPFAIGVADMDFTGAKESTRLDVMYPDYLEWVKAGCSKTNCDWFQNPSE